MTVKTNQRHTIKTHTNGKIQVNGEETLSKNPEVIERSIQYPS